MRSSRLFAAALALATLGALGLLGSSGRAAAQEEPTEPAEPTTELAALAACQGGRARSEATLGRCCWPGQRWDEERARCAGPPRACPAGRVAEGDRCIVDESAPPPRREVPAPPAPRPPAAPRLDWPEGDFAGRRNPRLEPALDLGLLGAGGGVFALGYLITAGFGIVDAQNPHPCADWGYTTLIPLAGGLVWGGGQLGCDSRRTSGILAGVPGTAIQLAGAGVMLAALILAEQPRWIYDEASLELRPRVAFARGGGEAGIEAELRF